MGFYGNLWKKGNFVRELSKNIHCKHTKYSKIYMFLSICGFNLEKIIILKRYKNLLQDVKFLENFLKFVKKI